METDETTRQDGAAEIEAAIQEMSLDLNNPISQRVRQSRVEFDKYTTNTRGLQRDQDRLTALDELITEGRTNELADEARRRIEGSTIEQFRREQDPDGNTIPSTIEEIESFIQSPDYVQFLRKKLEDRIIDTQRQIREYESSPFFRDPRYWRTTPTNQTQIDLVFRQIDKRFDIFMERFRSDDIVDGIKNLEETDLRDLEKLLLYMDRRHNSLISHFERLQPRPVGEQMTDMIKHIRAVEGKISDLRRYLENPSSPFARRLMARHFGGTPVAEGTPPITVTDPKNLLDGIIEQIDEINTTEELQKLDAARFRETIDNIHATYRDMSRMVNPNEMACNNGGRRW